MIINIPQICPSANDGLLNWQIYEGKLCVISITGLKLKSNFNNGNVLNIITIDNPPLVEANSTVNVVGTSLYLTLNNNGLLYLSNYSGVDVIAGSVIQGQIVYIKS